MRLHGGPGFAPAWRTILTSGGGANSVIHSYSDGTLTASGDTFGAWQLSPSASCTLDGTTYAAPCWNVVNTTDSMPAAITWAGASSGNNGPIDYVKAPSNLAVQYLWFQNKIYVSTNSGASWTYTDLTISYNANGNDKQTSWMAVDPANPDIVYLVTPANSYTDHLGSHAGTLLVNSNGRSCTSSCWTAVAGIPAPSGFNGGNVVFDPTSGVVGGVTQGIYASISGSTGAWHSTNGSTFSQANGGSPPTNIYNMTVDKFGQLWAIEGFRGTQGKIYKFASSTWTNITVATSTSLIAILQDPNTGASVVNNQMVVVDNNGQITATLNNGTDSWAHTIGVASLSLQAIAPQAGWLNNIQQYDGAGHLNLNAGTCVIDSAGKIWCGTGIDVFTTPDPITSGSLNATATYSANTIGMNQLVNNLIMTPPGLGVLSANWDRGVITNNNPDVMAALQFPNKNSSPTDTIVGSWGLDYAPSTPTTLVGAFTFNSFNMASSTDGGNSWSYLANFPTGLARGAVVAASSTTNFVSSSGQGTTGLQYTLNGGSTAWSAASISGTPAAFISSFFNNRQPLACDRVTANQCYAVDINQKFFSTTNLSSWAPTGAVSANVDGIVQSDRIIAVPGNAGHVFYEGESGHVWKSTNAGVNFAAICSGLDASAAFGFGAPKPAGSGYPTIAAYQIAGGTLAQGYYLSYDAGATCSAMNVPASEKVWASHVSDFFAWIAGDLDIYGRWYVGVTGSGPGYYIDTQDACPWVNFSNAIPNQSFTGTVTLTAQHSGLVPVSGVNFYVDGVQIGSTQTGQASYSVSWVTGGVGAGAHTLKVQASGNGCTFGGTGNSKSIPVTTH